MNPSSSNSNCEQRGIIDIMDPSSSNLNWEQRGIMYIMDTDKYKAASEGNLDAFKDYTQPLDHLVTHTKNTVLHIHLSKPRVFTEFVKHILAMCPSLLKQTNIKGETPLHIAARFGHLDEVEVLIGHAKVHHEDLESGEGAAKEMLRMTNKEKNTALHEAVRHNHVDVVRLLIKEDPDFLYSTNDYGETPIYMAALRGYIDVVEIIQNCTSKTYGGPEGKTALHAAVIRGDQEMTRKILEKTSSLTQEADQKGWTPLHYASDLGDSSIVELLLNYYKSAAYNPDKDGKIALHIAVSQNHKNIVRVLLTICPDCCELVDNRGWNVFHFAMENRSFGAVESLCFSFPLTKSLVNEKDIEGNTPLHLLAASWADKDYMIYLPREVDVMAVNQRNQSAIDIFSANNDLPSWKKVKILKWLREKVNRNVVGRNDIKETLYLWKEFGDEVIPRLEKAKEYHLVVAALVATVTFAAAFTVPGGYISEKGPDQGTPILRRSSAFKAFVITDALAMMLSTSAVFIHFVMALKQYKGKYIRIFINTFNLTVLAMEAMVVAFVTGTYAVLGPSPGLAIVTCVIGLCFFLQLALAISIIMPNVGEIIRDLFCQCFVRD